MPTDAVRLKTVYTGTWNESLTYSVVYKTNLKSAYRTLAARANYFGTTLYSHQTVSLDSGRFLTTCPLWGTISFGEYNREAFRFKYYIVGEVPLLLHYYMFDEDSHEAYYARRNFLEVVLVFQSQFEKDLFLEYVLINIDYLVLQVNEKTPSNLWRVSAEEDPAKSSIAEEISVGEALNKMLIDFRQSGALYYDIQ